MGIPLEEFLGEEGQVKDDLKILTQWERVTIVDGV